MKKENVGRRNEKGRKEKLNKRKKKESEIVNPDSPPIITNKATEKISQTDVLEEQTTVFDIESIAETCVLEELEDILTMSDSVVLLEHDASPICTVSFIASSS